MINILKLTVLGKVPAKSSGRQLIYNRKTGRPFIISSKETLQYERDFAVQVCAIKCPFTKEDRLSVRLHWFPPDNRQDIDSVPKTVFDCLQKCEIIPNDNKFDFMQVLRTVDKKNPRVEIEITKRDIAQIPEV